MRGFGRYSGCHMASCTCCTMSSNLTPAKPSACAVSATATATVADTLRKSSICGSSDAPGWRTVTRLETALGRRREHTVTNSTGLRDDSAEAQTGVQHSIIHLSDDVGYPLVSDRRERAARGDQRPPVSPGNQICGVRFGPRLRIGEREDDRPLRMRRHFLDDSFGETACDCRRAVPTTCARTVTAVTFPLTLNWTSKTRSYLRECAACKLWWPRRRLLIMAVSR